MPAAMPVTPMPADIPDAPIPADIPDAPMPADIPDAPVPAQPEPEPATTGFSGQQVIDASTIAGRLRSEVTTRPQALEDIAFASPYVQNGQFTGFRLRPGRDRQLFGQLGLNGGDVITEINGVRLNNPAQGLTMLQELMNASRVDVRVLRNGAEIPLTFSLDGPSPNEQD
jgi:general secretion pathway protein C